jgi:hypothetical protein
MFQKEFCELVVAGPEALCKGFTGSEALLDQQIESLGSDKVVSLLEWELAFGQVPSAGEALETTVNGRSWATNKEYEVVNVKEAVLV